MSRNASNLPKQMAPSLRSKDNVVWESLLSHRVIYMKVPSKLSDS